MRARGISYDTGFVRNGAISREGFVPEVVERELRIIRDDLHCNAVRVIGGDPDRLEIAATLAADLGLEVWFSPYPLELSTEQMLPLFADCAERAERLRSSGADVVFVTGAELSLMNKGFLPGDNLDERVEALSPPDPARQPVPDTAVLEEADLPRDQWEFEAVQHALERGLPILAICKGTAAPECGARRHAPARHSRPQSSRSKKTHDVQPLRNDASATHRFEKVNSSHHQAIDRLADGCVVESWCATG